MTTATTTTKPGLYGTLYLFKITYTDDSPEPNGFGEATCKLWAYDYEHARERFVDSDDEGWRILNIKKET